jgi:hypothetical protein
MPDYRREFTMSSDTLSNEAASKNLVKGFVQQEKWRKVEELAKEGNTFAVTALENHKNSEIKRGTEHMKNPSRYASKKSAKVNVDFSQLEGPAAAGKRGGGMQAPKVVQPPLGSEEAKKMGLGVKTNVGGGNGPKKTATTIVKNISDGGKGKGKKSKNK